jgi:hypothetical protein
MQLVGLRLNGTYANDIFFGKSLTLRGKKLVSQNHLRYACHPHGHEI